MRIVLWSDGYLRRRGGSEQIVHDLAAAFDDRGLGVDIMAAPRSTLPGNDALVRDPLTRVGIHEALSGHPLRRAPRPIAVIVDSYRYAIALLRTARTIHALRPQVVNVHYVGFDALAVVLMGWFLRYRTVLTFTGGDVALAESLLGARIRVRMALRLADAATAVSHDLVARLRRLSPADVRCVPNGVEIPPEQCDVPEAGPFGEACLMGSTTDSARTRGDFVFVGRLVPVKRVPWLLRNFRRCVDRGCSRRLHIVGEGEESAAVRRLTEELGLNDQVVLRGDLPHADVLEVMRQCACLVLTSENEGLPMVILEAMAVGRAVIASNVGGVSEIVLDGETGWLFHADDSDSFCTLVMAVASDATLAHRAGARGRQAVTDRWSNTIMVDSYLDIYRRVTGEVVETVTGNVRYSNGNRVV